MPEYELAVEDYFDAIVQTVKALGGYKTVGVALRPDKDAQAAGRWLSDCCNPNERETLQPTQLAYIRRAARERGIHILAAYEMRDAGYAAPVPVEPEDEFAKLQRVFNESVAAQAGLVARMEQLAAKVGAR
ncbi:MAG: hypothetical protein NVV68_06875 [Dokdonella sp.]|nr:hypothetical protein [Dokdonella sp.]